MGTQNKRQLKNDEHYTSFGKTKADVWQRMAAYDGGRRHERRTANINNMKIRNHTRMTSCFDEVLPKTIVGRNDVPVSPEETRPINTEPGARGPLTP